MSLGSKSLGSAVLGGTLPVGLAGFYLFIESINRSGLMVPDTLQITDQLGQRNTMTVILADASNSYLPDTGDEIEVFKDGILVYGGTVDTVAWSVGDDNITRFITLTVVDFNQIGDRFLVTAAFSNTPADSIAAYILTNLLAREGISAGRIDAAPTIIAAVYNYMTVTDVMNELCQQTGYVWFIDYNKRLNFFAYTSNANVTPFNVTPTSRPWRSPQSKKDRSAYRNRQYLVGGMGLTDIRTEIFAGDSKRGVFTLSFPVALSPTSITVNNVPQTVGIQNIDTGKQWYWGSESNQITQDSAEAPLLITDILAVTYQGFVNINSVSENSSAIADRQNTEGGSGIYENIVEDSAVSSMDIASQKIDGLLQRFAQLLPTISFETDNVGFRSGQLMQINSPVDGVADGTYLISAVILTYLKSSEIWRANVTATSGQFQGGWVEYFKNLLGLAGGILLRANDVSAAISSPTETLTISDSVNTTDALDDGSGDPYTIALVGSAGDDPNLQSGLGIGVV